MFDEENQVQTFITKVVARDIDSGANGAVSYYPDEISSQFIAVDPKSGIVRAKVSFSYENQRMHQFRIFAKDGGDAPLSASTTLFLTITDVNDEEPKFKPDRYTFGVKESVPVGSEIGQVSATDADSHPFNRFEFRLESAVSSADAFYIDPKTGMISTRQMLDREKTSMYFIAVVAYSDEVPFYSSTASVTISVIDVNDNAPRFIYPTERNNTVRVSGASPIGHVICVLRAEDLDENKRVTFGIEEQADGRGSTGGPFGVDPDKGSVVVNVQLQEYVGREFSLRLVVCDHGEQQLMSRAELRVHITNDPMPVTNARTMRTLLASESLTVVLAIILGTVVVCILIIIAIVVVLRKRRMMDAHDNGVVPTSATGPQYIMTTLPPSAGIGVGNNLIYEKKAYTNGHDAIGPAVCYSTVSV